DERCYEWDDLRSSDEDSCGHEVGRARRYTRPATYSGAPANSAALRPSANARAQSAYMLCAERMYSTATIGSAQTVPLNNCSTITSQLLTYAHPPAMAASE